MAAGGRERQYPLHHHPSAALPKAFGLGATYSPGHLSSPAKSCLAHLHRHTGGSGKTSKSYCRRPLSAASYIKTFRPLPSDSERRPLNELWGSSSNHCTALTFIFFYSLPTGLSVSEDRQLCFLICFNLHHSFWEKTYKNWETLLPAVTQAAVWVLWEFKRGLYVFSPSAQSSLWDHSAREWKPQEQVPLVQNNNWSFYWDSSAVFKSVTYTGVQLCLYVWSLNTHTIIPEIFLMEILFLSSLHLLRYIRVK